MAKIILVTGGARSGKSTFAELLAGQSKGPVGYIATAQIFDEEMSERVNKHRQQRPADWIVVEEPINLVSALEEFSEFKGVVLVDCVTIWLSNLLLPHLDALSDSIVISDIEKEIFAQVTCTLEKAKEIKPQVIFVTNEVGQGIVPENLLARLYRDIAGRMNQVIAKASDEVYLVVAGYPIEIKTVGQRLLDKFR